MDKVARVQIMDKAVYISQSVNTFRKGMILIFLSPAIGKLLGRLDFLTLVWPPVLKKENTELKPVNSA